MGFNSASKGLDYIRLHKQVLCIAGIVSDICGTCETSWCYSILATGFSAWPPCHVAEQANIL